MRSLALGALALLAVGCSANEATESSADALHAPGPGDVDEVLLATPASTAAPAPLDRVKSWSVHHVLLRSASDPFDGFFLIAKDDGGAPLFIDTIALTGEGATHTYFSLQTGADGKFFSLALDSGAAWLTAERARIGDLIRTQDTILGVKCIAEVAVFLLTLTNPILMLASQAVVDGTFAVIDVAAGLPTTQEVESAELEGGLAAAAKGAKTAVNVAVDNGWLAERTAKLGGGGLLAVAVVGTIGYQTYEGGVSAGLAVARDLVVPQSCQATYAAMTR